jgi:hypothetical protein
VLPEEVDVVRLVFRAPQLLQQDTSAAVMRMMQLVALLPGHDIAALISTEPTLLAGPTPTVTSSAPWSSTSSLHCTTTLAASRC